MIRAQNRRRPFRPFDFPAWKWKKLEAAPLLDTATGTWKLPSLLTEVDANGDGTLTVAEVEGWLKTDANLAALRRLVVKVQSEWDGSDPDGRWGYVKKLMAKDPEANRAALKRKLEWLEAQRSQAETALPKLDQRLKGWEIRLASLEKEREQAKTAAKEAGERQTTAEKTLKDLKAKTADERKAMGQQTWKDHVKTAEEDLAEAKQTSTTAQAQVGQDERAIAQAKVWMMRDTLKAAAARDLAAGEPARKQTLEKELKALEGVKVNPEDEKKAEDEFKKFKAHIAALQWWKEVEAKVSGFPASTDVWHFHPLHFIEQMKKCHWLCEGELEAIYPKTPKSVREEFRPVLNCLLWKYGWTSPARLAHFFGQAWVESDGLTRLQEGSEGAFFQLSRDPEPNGFYREPWDIYYTHVCSYNNEASNTDKERLVDAQGKAVDLEAELAKDDEAVKKEIEAKEKEIKETEAARKKRADKLVADKTAAKPGTLAQVEKDGAKDLKELDAKLKTLKAELEALEKRQKDRKGRRRKIAKEKVDRTKSNPGDGQKFRGRGMKQLTFRGNYAGYWVWRGWLKERMKLTQEQEKDPSYFHWHWWDGQGKKAAVIPDPQRLSEEPFHAVDSGGWFFLALPSNPKAAPMVRYIQSDTDVSDGTIFAVSKALNGAQRQSNGRVEPNGLQDRIDRTRQVYAVTGDETP